MACIEIASVYQNKINTSIFHDNKLPTLQKKIVKITNSIVSTVARNNGNCNLIGHVGCYDCIVIYMYTNLY